MKLGILMDPIDRINIAKDSSFAMLLEAQRRNHVIYYMEPQDVSLHGGVSSGRMRRLTVEDNPEQWFEFNETITQPLAKLDCLLMRKDPPFNMQYVYLTYLLEQAEAQGLRVVNKPASLRDANEKLFTAWFPQCCPNILVSNRIDQLKMFIATEKKAVIKPLGTMGGESIFVVKEGEPNTNVILETMTKYNTELVMAQSFIPEINKGDKRVLLINGKPIPHALARIPADDDFRGNISSGARTEGISLSDRDLWICEQIAPTLIEKGLIFVGIDIIGDYLTEINVTSPTGIRELDTLFNLNIASTLFDTLEELN